MDQDRSRIFIPLSTESERQAMYYIKGASMIYGYVNGQVEQSGLKTMAEVCLQLTASDLVSLANFLILASKEMAGARSESWHMHAPSILARSMECDVVVTCIPGNLPIAQGFVAGDDGEPST